MKRVAWGALGVGLVLSQLLWINSITPQIGLSPENFPFELGGALQLTDFIFLTLNIALAILWLIFFRKYPQHISWPMIVFPVFVFLGHCWILAQWYLGAPGIYDLLPESWAQAIADIVLYVPASLKAPLPLS